MTCAHFRQDQICKQVVASFSSPGHPTEVNASQRKWRTFIVHVMATYQPMKLIRDISAVRNLVMFLFLFLFFFFLQLASIHKETCESVWPPNASPYASSTCGYLRLLATTCEPVWPGLCREYTCTATLHISVNLSANIDQTKHNFVTLIPVIHTISYFVRSLMRPMD